MIACGWMRLGLVGAFATAMRSIIALTCSFGIGIAAIAPKSSFPASATPNTGDEHQETSQKPKSIDTQSASVRRMAQQVTVRILTSTASGSGAIVQKQGQTYTVLTSWHVIAFSERHTIIAPDGRRYTPISRQSRQLGNTDLAITQFRSTAKYEVARISTQSISIKEQVFAAGFPMYRSGTLTTTFDMGIQAFQFTSGEVTLLPPKSLPQGYRLGYTNDIVIGMSGGPIFNASGLLIGINGRIKNRDPDFGVYTFEDGTEPSPGMLQQMVNSSWGIPISTYLQFTSVNRRS